MSAQPASYVPRRGDLPHALVHWTKPHISPTRPGEDPVTEATAFEVLQTILREKTIRAGRGMVLGPTSVVCWTETPLSQVWQMLKPVGRYEPYGICAHKQPIWRIGGRPAMYLPASERAALFSQHQDQIWRAVRFEGPGSTIDFTNEREWRVPSDVSLDDEFVFYVIVNTHQEADQIRSEFGQWIHIRGILVLSELLHMI